MSSWLNRIRFISVTVLAISFALLIVNLFLGPPGRTAFGPPLGPDFIGFYTAATTLRRGQPEMLYDGAFQKQMQHELFAELPDDFYLPYLHPPFVAMLLVPLTYLPYPVAFVVWVIISLALFALAFRTLYGMAPESFQDPLTAFLFALSFLPFIMECVLNGQLSTIGFVLLAVVVRTDISRRYAISGLALGCLAYKPTLIVLAVPTLIFARRWKTLGIAILVAVALGGLSWMVVPQAAEGYLGRLTKFEASTNLEGGAIPPLSKFVDLNSFFRLLTGAEPQWTRLLLVLTGIGPGLWLCREAWRLGRINERHSQLIWSAVLIGTPALNVYAGIYDATMVIGGIMLAIASNSRLAIYIAVAIYTLAWVTQPIAKLTSVQLLTPALIAAMLWQLWNARREPSSRVLS